LINFQDMNLYLYLFGIVTFLGIIISWISNYFAVRKYLKIKTDFLYL
jgi:cell division protein FtsX